MKKILVIEDEELVRNNIVEILDTVDFRVIGASNGGIGVQLAEEHLPDLILCDVMMPELDGYGVLAALRNNPVTATIPFIFLTAKGDKTDIRQGMNLGADDYLTKPFRRKELLGAIEARLIKHDALYQGYTRESRRAVVPVPEVQPERPESIYYDHLTNLPNQLLVREQFEPLRDRTHPEGGCIWILLIGLDRFKRINQSLGHDFGDRLLMEVAQKLSQCVRPGDILARLHTDQFVIVLASGAHNGDRPTLSDSRDFSSNNTPKPSSEAIAQPILDRLTQPFCLENREIFITASIGISTYPQDGKAVDALMKNAGVAMSYAKQLGGNQYRSYTPTLQSESLDDLCLETSLRYAVERQELQLYYQPIVGLKNGRIVGAEALLRWHHPQRGMISPVKFIPLAEQTGLIAPIGEWVLQTACNQTKSWQAEGLPPVRVAVNLSFRQFNQLDLSERLVRILYESGLNPSYLELELTESILVQNVDSTIAKLNELKAMGVKISLDDFGTGYSSLSYLQQFPFDLLKIDRCFVQGINTNPTNAALTKAIIQMAHSLNLKVIAEGVETREELAVLYENQCDNIQGYFFSRPVKAEDFKRMLQEDKQLERQSHRTSHFKD
ncbi:EAL domain-containing response regulator [Oscillatoria acuminata]|uniref:Diguanylate cyclase (GGDEF) domain-containing protein n=1 Tax=Oscillatoria acuminata PCC 6304 TaxID=56110 RepID=K9TRI9_9CYAN|nr:GGDEF domain-containing response regulator [Oscillatoria acuminata]AFY85175.1 diguanylate cyclase (GGDEF) domain-containing protein [Oscillatoria acuminata PCC 6304]